MPANQTLSTAPWRRVAEKAANLDDSPPSSAHVSTHWPRWRSLSFRLSLAVNVVAGGVLVGFWALDYRRERHVHLTEQADRLMEEARVLAAAQPEMRSPAAFERYIDAYCSEMNQQISPGHHIALADATGRIVARARTRADADLESKMVLGGPGRVRTFPHAGDDYMSVATPTEGDHVLLVAQSLTPVTRVIRRQTVSRAISVTVLLGLLVAVTNFLLVRWVRQPIRQLVAGVEAIRAGRYDHRVDDLGTEELQFLGDGFNRMSAALDASEQHRAHEMAKARRIHLSLLPPENTAIPGATWAARYMPADEIGGDFYDLIPCPDGRWLWVVADISGHGIPAALITAMLKSLTRQSVRQGQTLVQTISILNQEIETLVGTEHFVTCLLVLYDPSSSLLEYVNCGHEPAVVVDEHGQTTTFLRTTGLPLGVDPHAGWETATAPLQRGHSCVMITDGLPEATDLTGCLLGRERLLEMIRTAEQTAPLQFVERLLERVRRFDRKLSFQDDVTILIVHRDS